MPSVTSLLSTKCGVAPQYRTALAVATKVSVGTSTSSPGSTPASSSATCSAAVPLTTATACLAPVNAARSASNRSTNLPTDETKVVSRHSFRYDHSLPAKTGSCRVAVRVPSACCSLARTAAASGDSVVQGAHRL